MANEAGAILTIVLVVILIALFIIFSIYDYGKTSGGPKLAVGTIKKKATEEKVKEIVKTKSSPVPEIFTQGKIPPANLVQVNDEIDETISITGIAEPFDSLSTIDDILSNRLHDAVLKIARKLSFSNPHIIINEESVTKKDGSGRNTVASVLINKGNEAFFGTPSFSYQTIRITTYPGYDAYPDKLIYVIAHELCHKILHSIDRNRPSDEKDERETDVAVVLLGFGNSYMSAKNVDNGLGYLNMDEAQFLKSRTDRILDQLLSLRADAYKGFVRLCRENGEQISFLNALYKAEGLRNGDHWELNYATAGDDYNNLLIATKTISIDELKEFGKLCAYFRKKRQKLERYRLNDAEYHEKLKRLTKIVAGYKTPDVEILSSLKKYS